MREREPPSAGSSDDSPPHADHDSVHRGPTRRAISPFALAALLLEVVAVTILIAVIMTEPPDIACSSVRWCKWSDRSDLLFFAATLIIPLGLVLAFVALVGAFLRRRQPPWLNTSAWVGALLVGFLVNPFLWVAALDAETGTIPCLCETFLHGG
jgi:hypothetical protein